MKINKNILICALFVLVMLCVIGSASAEDPLNENLTATDAGGVIDDDVNEELSISDRVLKETPLLLIVMVMEIIRQFPPLLALPLVGKQFSLRMVNILKLQKLILVQNNFHSWVKVLME